MGASLTHVCMWKDNNWKRISADEAAKIYPSGRSAYYKTFVCELCNQYVTFVRGSVMIPHFRHNSKEEIKECEDRREIYGKANANSNVAKGLPLKLSFDSAYGMKFQIGFTPLPLASNNKEYQVRIKGNETFVYNISRLNGAFTYLDVGTTPSRTYSISVIPNIEKLHNYWPSEIPGVSFEGTVFDKQSGKKLPYDADVQVDKEYYILSKYSIGSNNDIYKKEVFYDRRFSWHICEVKAKDYSENAAKFFLRFHCRLTVKPVTLYPLWPVYNESPYLICTNKSNVFFGISGKIDRIEPISKVKTFPYVEPYKLLALSCDGDQVNLSVGRLSTLRYLSVRKTDLAYETDIPEIRVFDLDGVELQQGEQLKVPPKNALCFSARYDGFVEVIDQKNKIEKLFFKSNEKTEIDNIGFGRTVRIYQGFDKVWEAVYIRSNSINSDEDKILNELVNCKTRKVTITHSLGALINRYQDMPKIKEWLYKRIKEGVIDEKALKILRENMG